MSDNVRSFQLPLGSPQGSKVDGPDEERSSPKPQRQTRRKKSRKGLNSCSRTSTFNRLGSAYHWNQLMPCQVKCASLSAHDPVHIKQTHAQSSSSNDAKSFAIGYKRWEQVWEAPSSQTTRRRWVHDSVAQSFSGSRKEVWQQYPGLQPFLGSALLTLNGEGARKGALIIVCFIIIPSGKPHSA